MCFHLFCLYLQSKNYMNRKIRTSQTVIISLIAALLLFYGWLSLGNGELLYTIQDHSLFLSNSSFWHQCVAKPMGICSWAGAWLTQFFYYPFFGSLILVLLWGLVVGMLQAILKLKEMSVLLLLLPICALLTSITDLGYWVYSMKDGSYAYSHTLALLTSLCFVYFGTLANKSRIAKWLFAVLFPIVGYPLCGCYMLLGAFLFAVAEWKKDNVLCHSAMLIISLLVPYCMANIYTTVPIDSAWWYGFPEFNNNGVLNLRPQVPFYLLFTSIFLLGMMKHLSRLQEKIGVKTGMIIIAASMVFSYQYSFRDQNFRREMRMYRAAEECRWDDVLNDAKSDRLPASQQVAMLRNVALLNLGRINEILDYDCWRVDFNLKDDMYHNIIQMGIPYIYYQYGQLHHATRWAIELSVEYGYSVQTLKTLLRCARLSGEKDLEKKYSDLLNETLFYNNWQEQPAQHISVLNQDIPEELSNDANLCERFLLTHFMLKQGECNELTQELAIWSSMLLKNVAYFWRHFGTYHEQEKTGQLSVPVLQAAAMYGTLSGHDISELKLPEEIIGQYNAFQQKFADLNAKGYGKQQAAMALLPEYGHSYWWYYVFGPDEY